MKKNYYCLKKGILFICLMVLSVVANNNLQAQNVPIECNTGHSIINKGAADGNPGDPSKGIEIWVTDSGNWQVNYASPSTINDNSIRGQFYVNSNMTTLSSKGDVPVGGSEPHGIVLKIGDKIFSDGTLTTLNDKKNGSLYLDSKTCSSTTTTATLKLVLKVHQLDEYDSPKTDSGGNELFEPEKIEITYTYTKPNTYVDITYKVIAPVGSTKDINIAHGWDAHLDGSDNGAHKTEGTAGQSGFRVITYNGACGYQAIEYSSGTVWSGYHAHKMPLMETGEGSLEKALSDNVIFDKNYVGNPYVSSSDPNDDSCLGMSIGFGTNAGGKSTTNRVHFANPCEAGCDAPIYGTPTTYTISCPEGNDLNTYVVSPNVATTNPNVEVRWYDAPTGGNLVSNIIKKAGTYYAEFYDTNYQCASPRRSNPITITGTDCPTCTAGENAPIFTGLNKTTHSVVGTSTVDLTTFTVTNTPVTATLKWYTDATLTTEVATPTAVTAGTYYAAFYDAANDCKSPFAELNVWLDSDGDGVPDHSDLDNDNDGILDSVECSFDAATNYTITPSGVNASGTASFGGISTSYTLNQTASNGYNGVGYTATSTTAILATAEGNPAVGNDMLEYKFNPTGTSAGYNTQIRLYQTLGWDLDTGTNEASEYTITWDGGGMAEFVDAETPSATHYIYSGLPISHPHHTSLPTSFDINNGQIKGLTQKGYINKGGTFIVYGVRNKTAEWYVQFPVGATNIIVKKRVLSGGTASGASTDPADGIDGLYPHYGYSPYRQPGESYAEFVTFQINFVKDTDGDGIVDCLDLDSDGDGCFDAIEGAKNITTAQVDTNGRITGGVDANGVPTLAGGGQGVGVSRNPLKSECQDTDGDGVPDYRDLDKDNDGILDKAECGTIELADWTVVRQGYNLMSMDATLKTYNISVARTGSQRVNKVTNAQPIAYTGRSGIIDAGKYAGIFSSATTTSSSTSGGVETSKGTRGVNATYFQEETTFTFTFDSPIQEKLYFYMTAIDNYKNVTVTALDGSNANLGAKIKQISDDGGLSGTDTFVYVKGAVFNNGGFTATIPKGTKQYEVVVDAGTSGDSNFFTISTACADTDGDGIPDYLETDSDGDGCPDAKEGAGNITNAQISSGRITGGVDANGVPTLANGGQGVGVSKNAIQNECQDSDGDGVPDYRDLDNDNDGILDTAECPSYLKNGELEGSVALKGLPANWERVPHTESYSEATTNDLDTPDTAGTSGPVASIGLAGNPAEGNTFVHGMYGTSTQGNFSQEGIKQTVTGLTVGVEYTLTFKQAVIKSYGYESNNGSWKVFIDGALKYTSPPSVSNTGYKDNNEVWEPVLYTFTATAISHEIAFLAYTESGNVSMGIDDIRLIDPCDTDGDGIPDYLDSDSDSDGCYDAIEGGGNVTSSNVNASGQITNNAGTVVVGTDGVPTGVTSGNRQAIGDSKKAVQITVTTQPTNLAICVNNNASFATTIKAVQATQYTTGTPDFGASAIATSFYYVWQVDKNDGSGFVNMAGTGVSGTANNGDEVTLNLGAQNDVSKNGYKYRLSLASSEGNCSVETNEVVLTVNSLPSATISGDAEVCAGITKQITFTGSSGTAPYTFSYTENGTAKTITTTGTNTTVTVDAPNTTGTYTYILTGVKDQNSCEVTGIANEKAVVTVYDALDITAQPQATTEVCTGTEVTLSTTVTGGKTPTYQWQTSTDNATWTDIATKTTPTYVFTPTNTDAGTSKLRYYRLKTTSATEGCGTLTSNVAKVTTHAGPKFNLATLPEVTSNVDAGSCVATVNYTGPAVTSTKTVTLTYKITSGATPPATAGGGAPGTKFEVGTTHVEVTASNGCGTDVTKGFNVVVTDNISPVITCNQADIIVQTPANSCSASVTVPNYTFTDNCAVTKGVWKVEHTDGTVENSATTGTNYLGTHEFKKGVSTVTYTVSDASGNEATCSFTVTVEDKTKPQITLPNVGGEKTTDTDKCTHSGTYEATVSDNCDATNAITLTYKVGATPITYPYNFPVGTTTVNVEAKDTSGNTATDSFTVKVKDNQAPKFTSTCPTGATTIDACDETILATNYGANLGYSTTEKTVSKTVFDTTGLTATDNCTALNDLTYSYIDTKQIIGCKVVVTRTWKVKDTQNNESPTCVQTFEIQSETAPTPPTAGTETVSCVADIVEPSIANGKLQTITDACGKTITPTLKSTASTPNPITCDGNRVYTYEYKTCAGKTADWTYTYNVVTEDFATNVPANTTRTETCISLVKLPQPPVVQDKCGNTLTPTLKTTTSLDTTTPTSLATLQGTACFQGDVIFTYTYTDCKNNTHDWKKTVTVANTTAPTGIIPEDITVSCDSEVPALADAPASVTSLVGACGEAVTVTVADTDNGANGCSATPKVITRTFTLKDCVGNTKTYNQIITVKNEKKPVFTGCPTDIDANANSSGIYAYDVQDPTATSACGTSLTVSYKLTSLEFDGTPISSVTGVPGATLDSYGYPVGNTTVEFTATDNCGNTNTCSIIITVNDVNAPVMNCPSNDITVSCPSEVPTAYTTYAEWQTAGGSASDLGEGVDETSFALHSETRVNGSCSNQYTLQRIYKVADKATPKNWAYCQQNVIVKDETGPAVNGTLNPITKEGCSKTDIPVAYTTLAELQANGITSIADGCGGTVTLKEVTMAYQTIPATDKKTKVKAIRTYHLTDQCGNITEVPQTITIQDTKPPVFGDGVFEDKSAIVVEGCTKDAFPVPVKTVAEFLANYGAGGSLLQYVTAPITIADECPDGVKLIRVDEEVTDGCPIEVKRTYVISDASGNEASIVGVGLVKSPDLTFTGSLATKTLSEECNANNLSTVYPAVTTYADLHDLGITLTGNCKPLANLTITAVDGTAVQAGCKYTVERTYTIKDKCNEVTAKQTIVVEDKTAPVLSGTLTAIVKEGCASDLTTLAPVATTFAQLKALGTTVSVTDNCTANEADFTVSASTTQTLNASCPLKIERTYTVKDKCGNISNGLTQIITINAKAPALSVNSYTEEVIGCSISDVPAAKTTLADLKTATELTISDVCDESALVLSSTAAAQTSAVGVCPIVVERVYTIKDPCSKKSATFTHIFNVKDNTAPTISGTVADETLSGCDTSVLPQDLPSLVTLKALGLTITDNCSGTLTVANRQETVTNPDDCTIKVVRTIDVLDACGNKATASRTFYIKDQTPPTLKAGKVIPDDVNNVNACMADIPVGPTEADIKALYEDTCGNAITVTKTGTPTGTDSSWNVTYTYEVKDACGNAVANSPTVSYSGGDKTKPIPSVATLPDVVEECSATLTAPTATDVCGGTTTTITGTTATTTFTAQGEYVVKWTYDDGNGNKEYQTQKVIIKDTQKPVVECPTLVNKCVAGTTYTATGTEFDPTNKSDNCTITATAYKLTGATTASGNNSLAGTVFNLGTTNVEWKVTDGNNNVKTCTFTVTVGKTPLAPKINVVAEDDIVNIAEKTAGIAISGTGNDGETITVTLGGTEKTATVTSGKWTVNYTSAEIPNTTTATIKAVATEGTGCKGAEETKTITIDTTAPQPDVVANTDGSVKITPDVSADPNAIKTTITYTNPDGTTKTAVLTKDPVTDKWSSDNPEVVVDETTGIATIADDKVKDGTEVTAVSEDEAGNTGEDKDTAKDNTPPVPDVIANDDGTVTIKPDVSADPNATKTTITYVNPDGTTQTAVLTKDPVTDKWSSDNPEVVVDETTGIATIADDKVKDGTEVKAVSEDASGKTGTDKDVAKDNTPPVPDVIANDDGTVTIKPDVSADPNATKTTITYTNPDGTTKTAILTKDPVTGKWSSDNPEVVVDENTGIAKIADDKVKDGTEVTAVSEDASGKTGTDKDVAKDNTPPVPDVIANDDGTVTIKPDVSADPNATKTTITYTNPDGTTKTAVLTKDPNTGKWSSDNPEVVVDETTGIATIADDKVKDGTEVTAVSEDASGKKGEDKDIHKKDSDGDGVPDIQEIADGTDPADPCSLKVSSQSIEPTQEWKDADCDGDGITNGQEIIDGTSPTDGCDYNTTSQDKTAVSEAWKAVDCDNDGLTNGEELTLGTDPKNPDSDGDGVPDGKEVTDGTSPTDSCSLKASSQTAEPTQAWKDADCDGDGITNGQEILDGTSPTDGCDYNTASQDKTAISEAWKTVDCDNDGLTNGEELTLGTDPKNPDSDGDGVPDGKEVTDGTSPTNGCDYNTASQDKTAVSEAWKAVDCDNDGLTNGEELTLGTDPKNPDSDGDGVPDGKEVADGTSPTDPCSLKVSSQTVEPTQAWKDADCDGDGITNGQEILDGTDPLSISIDLSMTMEVDNPNPNPGDEIVFTITLSNAGPNTATLIEILSLLPSGYEYISSNVERGSYNENTGIWEVKKLEKGGKIVLTIVAKVKPTGNWKMVSEVVKANEKDVNSTPGNNLETEDDQAELGINVDTTILIPESFSPNGDGINDTFEVRNLQALYPNFRMEIRNRYGNIVYEYKHDGNPDSSVNWWDGESTGRLNFGTGKVPVGTYYYVIYYNSDNKKPTAGWVYLRR